MEILSSVGLIIVGFLFLVLGGELLVRSAVSFAMRLKVSPAVIGATIIAGGTSAPEMVTSAIASLSGTPDIAIGNVVGSNIFNILAIIGISAVLKPLTVDPHNLKFDYPILLFATVAIVVAGLDYVYLGIEGNLMLIAMVVYLFLGFWVNKASDEDDEMEQSASLFKDSGLLLLGFAGLIGGAQLALNGGIKIGELAGLSDRIIGITIISVGTGLPELVTSAVAAFRGRSDLALANVIGSNILNTFGVVGVAASISKLQIAPEILHTDMLLLAGITLFLLLPMVMPSKTIGRGFGSLFLAGYTGYVFYLIVGL